jgi:hypothetical protein
MLDPNEETVCPPQSNTKSRLRQNDFGCTSVLSSGDIVGLTFMHELLTMEGRAFSLCFVFAREFYAQPSVSVALSLAKRTENNNLTIAALL